MNDTLQLVLIVAVVILLWDRFGRKSTASANGNRKGSLQDQIAQMIEEEGLL